MLTCHSPEIVALLEALGLDPKNEPIYRVVLDVSVDRPVVCTVTRWVRSPVGWPESLQSDRFNLVPVKDSPGAAVTNTDDNIGDC